ncbi:MAG: fold metallo-hydrolase [Alphaproteobacteria bacterium]|nr:fold metallo-hydrolase [Alphaproteobacteria bacterium]
MQNKMRVVVMGSGGSGGVPYAGNVWGKCDPANPKNNRTRPSIYVEKGETRVVIDTGPDFRTQINRIGTVPTLDAVLYTHMHFDHTVGIDDLRAFYVRAGKIPVEVYAAQETLDELLKRFDYVLRMATPEYPPIAHGNLLPDMLSVGELEIQSFDQVHGPMTTKGFRIGDFAYSTDVNELPPQSLEKLRGIKTWIVGTFPTDEGTYNHAGLSQIKEWVEILKPEMTYLTHLTSAGDYHDLCARLPDNIRPGYDGLELFI